MANQNVGTPRFYIDLLSYLNLTGKYNLASYYDTFQVGLNPSSISEVSLGADAPGTLVKLGDDNTIAIPKGLPINFWATLGHNWGGAKDVGRTITPHFHKEEDSEDGWQQCEPYHEEIVNSDAGTDTTFQSDFDGFTITELKTSDSFSPAQRNWEIKTIYLDSTEGGAYTFRTGAMAIGNFYNMPHSPELSLTMSHEYDGVKKQETAGGSTLSYVDYYKPPDWDNLQAWQLGGWDRKYSGRRVWDLSWNYLSDIDLEPRFYLSRFDGLPTVMGIEQGADTWFVDVIHYTNGGQLPFIFCPNPSIGYHADTWTIPEFAICRFDMKTFQREQVANGVYNIKVKIKESW